MRLFDMHCDTLYECHKQHVDLSENALHIDLERGGRFDAWAQLFAVWMPDTLRGEEAWEQCRNTLEMAHAQAAAFPDRMAIADTAASMDRALEQHRCAALLGVEGGSALAGRLEHVDDLRRLGVRVITLTWNGANELGCGSGVSEGGGLTDFGKAAVQRMEARGITPDVSHLNEAGFWDVASCTAGPFIASHSVAAGVHAHPRNLTDEQFACIRDRGGVVGLNLCGEQLGEQSFEQVERHLDHYLSLDGAKTVGLGCDLDGTDLPPEWGGIQVMPRLYEYLCRKNYEEACLDRVFFGNCYDFFHAALTSG